MKKESIPSEDWETPKAVRAGGFLFLSGVTSKQPDGQYLAHGDIKSQTHVVIDRIENTLESLDSSLGKVVKITAYVRSIDEWSLFNEAYLERFPVNRPARTTIQAGGFEEGACVELDVIATE